MVAGGAIHELRLGGELWQDDSLGFCRAAIALLRLWDVFREALASTEIVEPRIPVVSNVDAKAHSSPEAIRDTLARQVCYTDNAHASAGIDCYLHSDIDHRYLTSLHQSIRYAKWRRLHQAMTKRLHWPHRSRQV